MTNLDELPEIRRSQTIAPFGIGAIYEWSGESFVACDTTMWGERGSHLELDRLARSLKIAGFRQSPERTSIWKRPGDESIPYMRFPQWHFCPNCRKMDERDPRDEDGTPPTCDCGNTRRPTKLVPIRFVQVCEKGHLSDVAWWKWAHSESPISDTQCESWNENLYFEIRGGAGLSSVVIRAECGNERSLNNLMKADTYHKCLGKQPWQLRSRDREDCSARAKAVIKGGSNVYYPRTISALDIPPASNYAAAVTIEDRLSAHENFLILINTQSSFNNGEPGVLSNQYIKGLAKYFDLSYERVKELSYKAWRDKWEADSPDESEDAIDIERSEFDAFIIERKYDERDNFITEHVKIIDPEHGSRSKAVLEIENLIEKIILGTRLREVRALTGFTRLRPGGEKIEVVTPDLDKFRPQERWLPATETFGEGIFLSFREKTVQAWETSDEVTRYLKATARRVEESGFSWLPEVTPRFIALHTLAHALILQLSFDCGYPASALQERIYSSTPDLGQPMAGILIYTATGDQQGSLGGLVRQGEPPRFINTLAAAIERIGWCSHDPVCREVRTGFESINRGACHSCALISETSCANMNLLLDRSLLLGDREKGFDGLLTPLINSITGEE